MASVKHWQDQRFEFSSKGVRLPDFDVVKAKSAGSKQPIWIHLGAGNLYRTFHAAVAQDLLDAKLMDKGVVAADLRTPFVVDHVYHPFGDDLLMVVMNEDATLGKRLLASTAASLFANPARERDWLQMRAYFEHVDLQLVTLTITEKGYALDTEEAGEDLKAGPSAPKSAMGIVTALLLARFRAGAAPIAMVTTDNFSQNGRRFRDSVVSVARSWLDRGLVGAAFVSYVSDESRVSFPWSMIDRISPNPSTEVEERLRAEGFDDVELIETPHKTAFASFANTEAAHYLVIEDSFPNGRPPLERAGVIMCDRETAERADTMKVTACLNPLHTCLAIYGCLLGCTRIWQEMENPDLVALIRHLGYDEDLPVVVDPGVLDPHEFIAELLDHRLPNRALPDAPQRIACDTSQKMPVRFGHTLAAYRSDPELDPASLIYIPLVIAGWLRYLVGLDDEGVAFELSFDPRLAELRAHLSGVALGCSDPLIVHRAAEPILSDTDIFVVNLYDIGLGGKIEAMLIELLAGPGAVAATIDRYVRA